MIVGFADEQNVILQTHTTKSRSTLVKITQRKDVTPKYILKGSPQRHREASQLAKNLYRKIFCNAEASCVKKQLKDEE